MIDITFDEIGEHIEKGDLKEWLNELRIVDAIKHLRTDEPQTEYDKGLQLFADILFDKEKSKQFLNECKAMGIEPQTERSE